MGSICSDYGGSRQTAADKTATFYPNVAACFRGTSATS
jgi:hypothetical protein